jgi:hypothetical protein
VSDKQRRYHAYLLRLWQVQTSEAAVWRSSLEEPGHGHKKTFANLSDLFAFLERLMAGHIELESEMAADASSRLSEKP